jgi:uncharacterized protein (TIGR02118 family)
MSAAYLVVYQGEPEDRDAFLDYYITRHLPIIRRWPGLRGIELDVASEAHDPKSTHDGVFMVSRFLFDDLDALQAALDSPERTGARADRDNIPPFFGAAIHQAVEILAISP